ncbi:SRPBCC family protein [Sphaerisporangium fuscum]|uniref:SRPBCC family protein n=1 Tax=Sphaerisporangium fuscum TaxID=2835868 RepID=UPI001BDBDDFC|nr:SRPBCC family protein [Sphaerisporangium fuscum]
MNESLTMENGRAVLRMERRLRHAPEKVWRAVTEPAQLGRWFPFQVTELDLQVGGKVTFDDGHGTVLDGVVAELDPPKVFAFVQYAPAAMPRESDTLLRFELRPEGGGCLLTFTHVFHDRPAAASYASGWEVCLNAMESVLAGEPVQWPEGGFPHLHQAYVEAFALAEGSAERDGEGWRVRFERQLTEPVEKVWARLGGATATAGAPAPDGFGGTGAVTALRPPAVLEYARAGGRVRWELSRGTGHGARLVLTETGLTDPAPALAAWRDRIEALAREMLP